MVRYAGAAVSARWADGGASTALALLALDRGGAALAGLLIGALNLPHALAGPFVGALADRSRSPRRLHAAALVAFAAALAGVATTCGRAPGAVPVGLALAAGTLGPLLTGGMSGLLVGLVAPADLPRAHALDAATYNVAGLAAPASVAAVAGFASPLWAALVLAAVVAAGAAVVLALPVPARHAPPARPARAPGRAGVGAWKALTGPLVRVLAVVWSRPTLRMTTVATTLSHAADGGLTLAAALLAAQLGHTAAAGGVLLSGFALGALLGSLAMNWPAARRVPPPATVLGSMVALGALLALAAAAPAFPVALCCVTAAGFFDGPLLAATLAVRGEEAPEEARTEVFTTTASLKITAGAVGAVVAGGLAGLGGRVLLLLVAAGTLLSALAGWLAAGRPPLVRVGASGECAGAGTEPTRTAPGEA
jgi:MFS family permease